VFSLCREARLRRLLTLHSARDNQDATRQEDWDAVCASVIEFFERNPDVVKALLRSARESKSRQEAWKAVTEDVDPVVAGAAAVAAVAALEGVEVSAAKAGAAPTIEKIDIEATPPTICLLCGKRPVAEIEEAGVSVACVECAAQMAESGAAVEKCFSPPPSPPS
jgi:hypothetical protein